MSKKLKNYGLFKNRKKKCEIENIFFAQIEIIIVWLNNCMVMNSYF